MKVEVEIPNELYNQVTPNYGSTGLNHELAAFVIKSILKIKEEERMKEELALWDEVIFYLNPKSWINRDALFNKYEIKKKR